MCAERYLTINEAALELAKAIISDDELREEIRISGLSQVTPFNTIKEGVIETKRNQFNSQLMNAAKQGEFAVRHPLNLLPYSPEIRRDFYELVSATDLNEWLGKNGVSYRLEADDQTEAKQSEPQNVLTNTQTELEITALFDPTNKGAIMILFDKAGCDWRKYFDRAARNGLGAARQGDARPYQYNPAKVAEWLVSKGLYSREAADRKLANNLPTRSKDEKYLITGELD